MENTQLVESPDMIKMRGDLIFTFKDEKTGKLRVEKETNLVTTVGKNWIAARMYDTAIPNQMSHMAVGTGNTGAAAGDTTLDTELDRNALDSTTVSTNTVTYEASWAAGDGTGALYEAGIFNAGAAGTMLCRSVFSSVKNKGAGDSLTITWILTVN